MMITAFDGMTSLDPVSFVCLRTTKCFEMLFFLANSLGQRWSTILFPMTRFPDDPIFQITRSSDHPISSFGCGSARLHVSVVNF